MINKEAEWSLTNAGIGPVYHNRSLSHYGKAGAGLAKWVMANRDAVALEGKGLVITGVNTRELIIMAARAYHMNGIGAFVCPVVKMNGIVYSPEQLEKVGDAQVLGLLSFQTERDCPLKPNAVAEVEHLIMKRADARKAVMFSIPLDVRTFGNATLPWWSGELVRHIEQTCTILSPADLEALA